MDTICQKIWNEVSAQYDIDSHEFMITLDNRLYDFFRDEVGLNPQQSSDFIERLLSDWDLHYQTFE